jgi:nuclear pore complex protein Nup85
MTCSEVVEALAAESPPDPNEVEDKMLYNFFVDNMPKAIQYAMVLDVWLGAHLADLMQAEGLIPSTPMKK